MYRAVAISDKTFRISTNPKRVSPSSLILSHSEEQVSLRISHSHIFPFAGWYQGPTLLGAIDLLSVPPRDVAKPFRMSISDVYKDVSTGLVVTGKVDSFSPQSCSIQCFF